MVLLPHPAGPVTMRMWWWLVMDMAGATASFNGVEEMAGEPVLEMGGVSGDVYWTGAACVGSTACIMFVV